MRLFDGMSAGLTFSTLSICAATLRLRVWSSLSVVATPAAPAYPLSHIMEAGRSAVSMMKKVVAVLSVLMITVLGTRYLGTLLQGRRENHCHVDKLPCRQPRSVDAQRTFDK